MNVFTKSGQVAKGADWVAAGAGVARRRYDGLDYRVENGKLFKGTGKVPVPADDPVYREAFAGGAFQDGTYELVGPGVKGNKEGFERLTLIRHQDAPALMDVPRTYDALREYLKGQPISGVTWFHEDGRQAFVSKADFEQ